MGEMQPKSDAQLLRDYAEHGAEAAFAEIVTRHTNIVYSARVAHGLRFTSRRRRDPRCVRRAREKFHPTPGSPRTVRVVASHRTNIPAQTVRTDVRRRAREQ